MSDLSPVLLSGLGSDFILESVVSVCSSFFYGLYVTFMWLSTRSLWRRGLRSRPNQLLLLATTALFGLITAEIVLQVYGRHIDPMKHIMVEQPDVAVKVKLVQVDQKNLIPFNQIGNFLFLLEAVIGDVLVVTRAYAVSLRSRRVLALAGIFWLASLVGAILFATEMFLNHFLQTELMFWCFVAVLAASLGLNLVTLLVTAFQMRHVPTTPKHHGPSLKIYTVLSVLVNSGILYILIWIFALIVSGPLNGHDPSKGWTIFTGTFIVVLQILAGIYPCLIIILLDRSANQRRGDSEQTSLPNSDDLIFSLTYPSSELRGYNEYTV